MRCSGINATHRLIFFNLVKAAALVLYLIGFFMGSGGVSFVKRDATLHTDSSICRK